MPHKPAAFALSLLLALFAGRVFGTRLLQYDVVEKPLMFGAGDILEL